MTNLTDKPRLFSLGKVVATQGIMSLINNDERLLDSFMDRHSKGDWGNVCKEDKEANNQALIDGSRLLSSYMLNETKIWIITEWDRSVTTILLPSEY